MWLVVVVTAAMLLGRAFFSDAAVSGYLFVAGAVFPAAVLAAMLSAALWRADDLARDAAAGSLLRVAMACAAGGFVLHNMVTYSLWMPGPASVFYVAVGACIARAGGGRRETVFDDGRWTVALLGAAAVVALTLTVWLPVLRRTLHTADMLSALERGDTGGALLYAAAAAYVDPLDPQSAADAASAALLHAQSPSVGPATGGAMDKADEMARRARRLDPQNAQYAQLAANVGWARVLLTWPAYARHVDRGNAAYAAGDFKRAADEWTAARRQAPRPELSAWAVDPFDRAVRGNPMGIRLRMAYARCLCDAGLPQQCLEQIDEVLRIDRRLLPGSVEHLTAEELKDLEALRARANWARVSHLP